VLLFTDGDFLVVHGFVVVSRNARSYDGGGIALVKMVTLLLMHKYTINLKFLDEEFARKAKWIQPKQVLKKGVLLKYIMISI
jgi:hypothetical protein